LITTIESCSKSPRIWERLLHLVAPI
jgi:hypothetical protein